MEGLLNPLKEGAVREEGINCYAPITLVVVAGVLED
jgi:hypothetical protein